MEISDKDKYIELAELARSMSGPVGKDLVTSAQQKLIKKLRKSGAVTEEEADSLQS